MSIRLDRDPATFRIEALLEHVRDTRRDELIIGGQNVSLVNLTKDYTLEHWLRTRVARRSDTRQATVPVVEEICATGLFTSERVVDPNTGRHCKAIVLTRVGKRRSAAMRAPSPSRTGSKRKRRKGAPAPA